MKQSYYLSLLCFFLCFSLSWGQLSKNYEVTTPGTLSQLVGTDKAKIINLSLTGTLNSADFLTIRQMNALKNLNLLHVNLVDNILPREAFSGITLNEIVLPKSLKIISSYAFYASKVFKLDFNHLVNLETIDNLAFSNIQLEENVLDFSKNSRLVNFLRGWNGGAFTNNTSKVILPLNLKVLSPATFIQFKGEAVLPEGLEELGNESFKLSAPSIELRIPSSVKKIGYSAFESMKTRRLDFTKVSSLETIDNLAFSNIQLEENVLDFSENSRLINFLRGWNGGAFTNNTSKVILPLNLKVLSPVAFIQFKGEAVLPEGLEELGNESFKLSAPSTELRIPSSVKKIGYSAFESMKTRRLDFTKVSSLETIDNLAFSNIQLEENVLDFSENSRLVNFLRGWNGGAFTNNTSKVILPLNLKVLSPATFIQFKGEAVLPEGLEELGNESFKLSAPSTELRIPSSVKKIGYSAFESMKTRRLDFSKVSSLETIDNLAFSNIQLEENVLDFSKNSRLENFLRGWNGGAFTNNTSKVILPLNLKVLSPVAFIQFKGEVVLPNGLEKISNQAFKYSSIKEIYLPSSLKIIETGAFMECGELEKLSICAITPPQLGTEVFKGINFSKVELSVPKNTLKKYNQASQWKDFKVSVETDLCLAGPEIIKDPQVNAPNSYIYDVDAAKANNYGGLEIPVAKAYAMWETNEYLEGKGIPKGTLSASVYWEDIEGLIRSVSVDQNAKDSKIKVMINRVKGKGNAVVALHVGTTGDPLKDPVYWSWHVWVTDNPTQGKTYINNQNGEMTNTFMDRNLGALSNSFLGHDWNRSGGLMYQWGRKDPLPVMRYIDNTFPIISTFPFGKIQNELHNFSVIKPGGTDINKNIQYATQNPLRIFKSDPNENGHESLLNWFSGVGVRADLWGDNNQAKTGLVTYKPALKSSFDPCPSGWRVPSFAYSVNVDVPKLPSYLPWGNGYKLGITELLGAKEEDLSSEYVRARYPSVKIYPGLGMDFKAGKGNYPLGQLSLTGHYRKYANGAIVYEDQASETYLWGATQAYKNELREIDGRGLGLRIISDASQNENKGFFQIQTANANSTYSGQAVRCVIDTRISEIGSYPTQYLAPDLLEYIEGINNPNSYMVVKEENAQTIHIPVNKAYAMYNQYLTDYEWPDKEAKLSVNIYWTTDTNLLKKPVLEGTNENATIKVTVNPNKSGNAVVSLHSGVNGNSNDKILWSWHIWVPNNSPVQNSVTYTTEEKFGSGKLNFEQLAYNTESFYPPLTTEFMDRNLGALEFDIASSDPNVYRHTGGMLYQWGRKDPLPSFFTYEDSPWLGNYSIFKGNSNNAYWHELGITEYEIYDVSYRDMFREGDSNRSVMKRSVENPLTVMFGPGYYVIGDKNIQANWLPEKDPTLWGHATKKSPFDPCPEGWRVPDHGFSMSENSPWKKENVDIKSIITKGYKGVIIANRGVSVPGLGQLPFTGYRAYPNRGSKEGTGVLEPGDVGGLWSASMINGIRNYALSLHYKRSSEKIDVGENEQPRTAMPVRCAKDQPRFTEESIANTPVNSSVRRNCVEAQSVEAQTSTLTESQIKITPNPTSGLFKVLLTGVTEGKLNVVNINGTVIHSQMFANSTEVDVNIQNQPSGVYVVQVQAQGQVVNKKVIKK
ncbi:leucine-rich repeat protein [Apibacter raozihei]|uniref:leucine-rich repeat protein n=1 Tax=Apibacter raozihei TaxID=2500547 RepID=UPI000FE38232|nr:leucine-rich repeat protein [Apibacter raozihei]